MLNSISRRELIRRFKALSFDGPYSGGRHLFMVKGQLKIHIPNPHGKDISKYLISEILKQASISVEEWESI